MRICKLFESLILILLCILVRASSNDNERKPYIVYMGALPDEKMSTLMELNHHNLLSQTIGDESIARKSKIQSYGRSFNGFVAKLLPHEVKNLSQKKGVVSVFPNTLRKLHTTRSWDFIGMAEKTTKRNQKMESNMIIGILDTGIWVESPSFNDKGYGPPPSKWKGKCVEGVNFTGCNNKVIGAQYFLGEGDNYPNLSPVDTHGHGTHTASTAAGVPVDDASLYGIGRGRARGGVPAARIASYKVCWGIGCWDMDLLAGFDQAIADGVDVISLSIGGYPKDFFRDAISIGAFHAMNKGIMTICAAGNEGPYPSTVQNVAPWITTVAASSIDRQFVADVELGNDVNITGIAINTFSPKKKMYPLTSGTLAANTSLTFGNASACAFGTLSTKLVEGKIVYCLGNGADYSLFDVSVGTIMCREKYDDTAFPFLIPATTVSFADGRKIDEYINSNKKATAVIHKSRSVEIIAPFITSFSARGPQKISPNILKPDIAAPGLSILAAHTKYCPITEFDQDKRFTKYSIESGTSMATPHVAGAAAYIKSFHPTWSPAAIKSALMTTATPMKVKTIDLELASGSGQINPIGALHPGLIYDIDTSSYIRYLCNEGYNATTIGLLAGGNKQYDCSSFKPAKGVDGINYPSFHFQLAANATDVSAVFERIVTNVGYGPSTYKAKVVSPNGLSITVLPSILTFGRSYEKKPFKVILKGQFVQKGPLLLSGSLEWNDSKHIVTSPIVVYRPQVLPKLETN